MAEGRGVEPPRPLSEPVPFRAGWACLCPNLPWYQSAVLPRDFILMRDASYYWTRLASIMLRLGFISNPPIPHRATPVAWLFYTLKKTFQAASSIYRGRSIIRIGMRHNGHVGPVQGIVFIVPQKDWWGQEDFHLHGLGRCTAPHQPLFKEAASESCATAPNIGAAYRTCTDVSQVQTGGPGCWTKAA
jgi:hypothetical protein